MKGFGRIREGSVAERSRLSGAGDGALSAIPFRWELESA